MSYKLIFKTVLFALVMSAFTVQAQDSTKRRREVGLQFSGLNFTNSSFGAFYKKEIKEHVYRRIGFFYGNISSYFQSKYSSFSATAGLAIGREKRKNLDSRLEFYQGPEFNGSFGVFTGDGILSTINLSGGFSWIFGLQHSFNERWAINLEASPGISIRATAPKGLGTRVDISASGNNSIALGLVRKF
jgi:hypothetical protein